MTPKTITAKIVVPEWAKWVATERSGQVWAYSVRPRPGIMTWVAESGMTACLFTTTPPRNWRKTLRRVK